MPRNQHAVRVRYSEAPGQIRRFAPELAIDEIPEPSGEKTDARQGRQEIEHIGNSLALHPREYDGRGQHSRHTPVKRHAAVPDMKHIEPILRDHVMAVENAPTHAAADDDADGAVKNEIVDIERNPSGSR